MEHNDILFKTSYNLSFSINPSEYGLDLKPNTSKSIIDLTRIDHIREVYSEELAPTTISVGYDTTYSKNVAIKTIHKDGLLNDLQRRQASREFPLTCSLKNSYIVEGYEWSEDEKEYVMLMEYMNNPGYLKEKIDTTLTPVKNEIKLQSYVADILEGVDYIHKEGIVHCDLKLENVLMNKEDDDKIPIVKVCDFGLAHIKDKTTGKIHMEKKAGSHSYIAPEVKNDSYLTEKIDIWSLGVMIYKMAVAYKPTQIGGYKYSQGPIPFRKFDWKKRSKELQDLLTQMLEYEPEKRISAHEALQHPWFSV